MGIQGIRWIPNNDVIKARFAAMTDASSERVAMDHIAAPRVCYSAAIDNIDIWYTNVVNRRSQKTDLFKFHNVTML